MIIVAAYLDKVIFVLIAVHFIQSRSNWANLFFSIKLICIGHFNYLFLLRYQRKRRRRKKQEKEKKWKKKRKNLTKKILISSFLSISIFQFIHSYPFSIHHNHSSSFEEKKIRFRSITQQMKSTIEAQHFK